MSFSRSAIDDHSAKHQTLSGHDVQIKLAVADQTLENAEELRHIGVKLQVDNVIDHQLDGTAPCLFHWAVKGETGWLVASSIVLEAKITTAFEHAVAIDRRTNTMAL